jgi:hypothetical protein
MSLIDCVTALNIGRGFDAVVSGTHSDHPNALIERNGIGDEGFDC